MRLLLYVFLMVLASCTLAQAVDQPTDTANRSVIEGTLLQVSKLPHAVESAYPDCYFTAIVNLENIVTGQSTPRKIIMVLPGFFNRQYAPEAKFKDGDKIEATIVPFASMPDTVRQTQQADDIENIDLDFYFPTKISLVQKFSKVEKPVPFAGKKDIADEHVTFHPIDAGARTVRQQTMQRDLEQINKLLAEHGGDWDKWYNSLKDYRIQYKTKHDAKTGKWIGDSFFSAGFVPEDNIYNPEFIRSVIAFKNYLTARNVDLILIRVPTKGEISDDLFASLPPAQVHNPYLLRMYKELLESDVEIITDIIPQAKMVRFKYPLMYWYQDFTEGHPAEGMSWVIAEEFSKRLNRYERIRNSPKKAFSLRQVDQTEENFRWPEGNSKYNPAENVRFSAVITSDSKALEIKQGLNSPYLVLGSSFITYPSIKSGGSIPHYMAYLTGIVPDIINRYGGDLTMPRIIAHEGDEFLKNRSVCLFPFYSIAAYKPLSSPQLANPENNNNVLLISYYGEKLHELIQIAPSAHVFSYSSDKYLVVKPINNKSGAAGSIQLKLPQQISKYSMFVIEIDFMGVDRANIMAKYSRQKYALYRNTMSTYTKESFVFKTEDSYDVFLELTDEISFEQPTIIKSINIYGLK